MKALCFVKWIWILSGQWQNVVFWILLISINAQVLEVWSYYGYVGVDESLSSRVQGWSSGHQEHTTRGIKIFLMASCLVSWKHCCKSLRLATPNCLWLPRMRCGLWHHWYSWHSLLLGCVTAREVEQLTRACAISLGISASNTEQNEFIFKGKMASDIRVIKWWNYRGNKQKLKI